MLDYLNNPFNLDDEDLASAYDEVPFWSFPFGEMILSNIRMRPDTTALDIGYGTGFPLLELSQRLGRGSTVYGIDPWRAAGARARFKAETLGIDNVVFVNGDGAAMPFQNEMFDLIVCSVGINNFEAPQQVFDECHRVAKPGAQLAFTTNPEGHMRELYEVFSQTLNELGLMEQQTSSLRKHEARRLSADPIKKMLERAGLTVTRRLEDRFSWRFADGSAFLRHHMIKRTFVIGWQEVVPREHHETFFGRLEENLNQRAQREGELRITIPALYLEAAKKSSYAPV